MDQLIILECPKCGKYFALKREPAVADVRVRCLACHAFTPYSHLIPVMGNVQSVPDEDDVKPKQEHLVPVLRLISPKSRTYYLKTGRNVIGRYAISSTADIQIDTGPLKHISREHAIIEVTEENGEYMCYFSLYKKEINDTYVSDKKVLYGNSVCLVEGDTLKLPDNTVLKYELEEEDGTSIE